MMRLMRVEIRERQPDGNDQTVAVFRCDGQVVTCDNPVIWNHLIQASGGVIIGERGRRFTPRDGDEYLRNLRFQYRGPYLFAFEVDEPAAQTATPDSLTARAVVVEVPEDTRERRAALDRAIFVLFVQWGAGEVTAAAETRETVSRLLEAETGMDTLEAFADDDLRIRLSQAR